MSRAKVRAGHFAQVEAYAEAAEDGREETHGVLAGGDWNEAMGHPSPIHSAMGMAGLRLIAHAQVDGLFASESFRCLSVKVLHPERPADHPWLFVTVAFHGHTFTVLIANTHAGNAIPLLRQMKRRLKPDLVLTCENGRPQARRMLSRAFPRANWSRTGLMPRSAGLGSSGTQVLARRRTFAKRHGSNQLLTTFLDSMHPERRLTYSDLRHRNTGLTIRAISAHTWTLKVSKS